jgi:hypothetical protein
VLSAVSAVVGLAAPVWAGGVQDKVDLNWSAPDPCPKRAEFLAAVTQMLGDRVTIARTLFANVVITQASGTSFQLKLTTKLDDASGQRIIEGRACKVVADAAAVTLALLLNPDLEVPAEPPPHDEPSHSVRTPTASAPPKHHTVSERQSPPSDTRSNHWYGLLSSQLGLALGLLPHANPQVSLGVGAGRERASILATGSYSPPQEVTLAAQAVGGHLWTASVGLHGCWLWTVRSPRLSNCLGLEATRLHGHGTGVPTARDAVTLWVSPSLSANADFALSERFWLRFSALGMLPLARPDTHLDDIGIVQKPAKVMGALGAGVVVRF